MLLEKEIRDVDGNTEQIRHNITGKTFPNENANQMLKSLEDLYKTPTLMSDISERAKDFYIKNY